MAGRGRPPFSPHQRPFPRAGMPHQAHSGRMEEQPAVRFGRGGPPPLPPPMMGIDACMASELEEASALLLDNQRLAATHVALMQELHTARAEIDHAARAFDAAQRDREFRIREMHDKLMKMESGLRAAEEMKAELAHVNSDVQKLNGGRQELMSQVQELTHELNRSSTEIQQLPALKAELEAVRQETQRVRAGIEAEKKGYTEAYEQGQIMERNLVSMAREVEKLRAEISNAEKRARAAAAAGNQGYGGNHGNQEPVYTANTYPAAFSMTQVSGVAGHAPMQYGPGSTHGAWKAYEMQQSQGRR